MFSGAGCSNREERTMDQEELISIAEAASLAGVGSEVIRTWLRRFAAQLPSERHGGRRYVSRRALRAFLVKRSVR
jgi:transposase